MSASKVAAAVPEQRQAPSAAQASSFPCKDHSTRDRHQAAAPPPSKDHKPPIPPRPTIFVASASMAPRKEPSSRGEKGEGGRKEATGVAHSAAGRRRRELPVATEGPRERREGSSADGPGGERKSRILSAAAAASGSLQHSRRYKMAASTSRGGGERGAQAIFPGGSTAHTPVSVGRPSSMHPTSAMMASPSHPPPPPAGAEGEHGERGAHVSRDEVRALPHPVSVAGEKEEGKGGETRGGRKEEEEEKPSCRSASLDSGYDGTTPENMAVVGGKLLPMCEEPIDRQHQPLEAATRTCVSPSEVTKATGTGGDCTEPLFPGSAARTEPDRGDNMVEGQAPSHPDREPSSIASDSQLYVAITKTSTDSGTDVGSSPPTLSPHPAQPAPGTTGHDAAPAAATRWKEDLPEFFRTRSAHIKGSRVPGVDAVSPDSGSFLSQNSVLDDSVKSDVTADRRVRERSRNVGELDSSAIPVVVKREKIRSLSQPPKSDARYSQQLKEPVSVVEEKNYFQVTDELSKENSHFAISEALVSAIEQYKANVQEQRWVAAETTPLSSPSHSSGGHGGTPGSASSGEAIDFHSPPPPSYGTSPNSPAHTNKRLSSIPGRPISEAAASPPGISFLELMVSSQVGDCSAESTAQRLLQHVAMQLTGDLGNIPQTILHLPTELLSSLKKDEDLQKSLTTSSAHMRGSRDWAPPREQIIFHIKTPSKDIQQDLASQDHRCAGCGMRIQPTHSRYFRFCHYTGKYFCQSCHTGALSFIPAYIMEKWSFRKYAVSNFARDLLMKIYYEPVFGVKQAVYQRVFPLTVARDLRLQLISVRKYLKTCKRARNLFLTFEGYAPWTTELHLYSIDDFHQVKTGGARLRHLRSLLVDGIKHIKSCPLCEGKGFVCEFCNKSNDIIYPFEVNRVSICRDCQCCFHKDCFQGRQCPRCTRLRERQRLKAQVYETDVSDSQSDVSSCRTAPTNQPPPSSSYPAGPDTLS